MDINNHNFINTTSWQQLPSIENPNLLHYHHDYDSRPLDHHQQWPDSHYPPSIVQSYNEPSNSSSTQSYNLLSINQATENDNSTIKINDYHHHREQELKDEADDEQDEELGPMKEMMYKIASMQPVDIDPSTVRKPRRRNVRISDDPQSVAARHRRERISEKIRILQRLVPGGIKMDAATMLDEAVRYVKFLKRQIRILQDHLWKLPPGTAATSTVVEENLPQYLFGANYNDNAVGESNDPVLFNCHHK